jgi:hypothetical protein
MAHLKPPWFTAKVFNEAAMAFGIGGSATSTVTKRDSKQLPDDVDHPVFALTPVG